MAEKKAGKMGETLDFYRRLEGRSSKGVTLYRLWQETGPDQEAQER